jgi:hypothetical protein
MNGSPDALTVAVTGHLPGILIAAAVLTWPVGWLLLRLYRRAVSRSMTARASGDAGTPRTPAGLPSFEAAGVAALDVSTAIVETPESQTLLRHLSGRPWHAARVYALAALAYAVVLTTVTAPFVEPGAPFRPIRFLLLTTMFAWPVVLTLAIVAGSVRQRKIAIGGAYTLAYVALVVIATLASPEFSLWQGLLLWALYNGPPTVLAAICLSRRIRAVGPMVLLFLILGLLGADVLLALVGSTDLLLRGAVTAGGWFGLGGVGTFFAMILVGFAAFAIVGAGLLAFIRRRYDAKQLSDESLTIDTLWWLFVFGHAVGLTFEHPLAPLGGVVAMVAFTIVTRVGLASRESDSDSGRKLLLLRSFSIGARAERLFDALEKHWRRVGSIQMIAGVDLATRTVEPHEFLDFVTGRLARRFIDGSATLERRLREMDVRPDRDGRYRVNDFFCYDDTWRTVLSSLVDQSDAVLMDLRGFSRRNAGCVFEIGELFRLVPLHRVIFIVDRETDAAFLDRTFGRAAALAAPQPGGGAAPAAQPRLFTCTALDVRTLQHLLRALAAAAGPRATQAPAAS